MSGGTGQVALAEAAGCVVLAAGGTGGHLFPAQALAAELLRRGFAVALITDSRGGNYEDRFPGVAVHRVRAATPAGQNAIGRLAAFGELAIGALAARRLLKQLRPRAVVGFGGYPSLPTMWAAARAGLPTLLHEQNALLGRVNRLLAPKVTAIATSFAATQGLQAGGRAQVILTGNPVRDAILAVREVPYSLPQERGPIRLMVLGGSQGARILSDVLPAALQQMPPELQARLRLTQQCRPEDLDRVRRAYAESGISADLYSFIDDVPALLAATHLCVTRAGASTVAELAAAGRPAVLVPYAHATDDHQTANAKSLADDGGAFMVPEPRFTAQALRQVLEALLRDPPALANMAAAARGHGRPQATTDLADLVQRLAAGDRNGGVAGGTALGRVAA